jgi:hypothetical protein
MFAEVVAEVEKFLKKGTLVMRPESCDDGREIWSIDEAIMLVHECWIVQVNTYLSHC